MKRYFLFFWLIGLFSFVCQSLIAHDFEVDGIYYTYLSKTDKTVSVSYKGSSSSSYSNEYFGNITIPTSVTYNGTIYNVTSIGSSAFYECTSLTGIEIPSSVTKIGGNAFQGCTNLMNIKIPNSVTSIGAYAFRDCTSLVSIEISDNVTSIGEQTFFRCTKLTDIKIPSGMTSIGNRAFDGCTSLASIEIPNNVNSLGTNVFEGCTNLMSIKIPNNVTIISNSAFKDCIKLSSVEIPDNVTSIDQSAFENCQKLTNIEIPNSVTSIGSSAFQGCSALTNIEISNNVLNIGSNAFYNTAWYKKLPAGLIYVGVVAYEYKGTMPANTYIVLKDGTRGIAACAFKGCNYLLNIEIPTSVEIIGGSAFEGCSLLTNIEIPSSVTSISNSMFKGCVRLKDIEIPNKVTSIGNSAFYGCAGLTSIEIPNNVSIIGSSAFKDCMGLSSIKIPNAVSSIGESAFSGCTNLTNIEFLNDETSIGANAFENTAWYDNLSDGLIYICRTAYKYKGTMPDNSNIILKDGTLEIASSAFSQHKELNSIKLPSSMKSIGAHSFNGCTRLANIVIPNEVTTIGNNAFYGCSTLKSVVIGKSVTEIALQSFLNCPNLISVTVLNPEPIVLPLGGGYNFNNRRNATLYVPQGSKSAYENAICWKEFKEIIEIGVPIEFVITDGEVLVLKHTETCDELVYTRTFANTNWQSLYVPFSIPVDSLSAHGLQVAELNDTHQWDFNGDGVADSTRVEFFTLTSGSTEANYPYLIRATEPTTLSLTLKDIEVKAAEENSIECSSTKQKFTFVGTYTGVSGTDMYDNNYYGMSGGGLKRVSSTSVSLKPQRWYMKIENKNGSPVNYFAPSIRFTVDGIDEEEEETSAIVDMCTESRNRHKAFYSLEGIRQHTAPTQRGMYVRQDKKLIIR